MSNKNNKSAKAKKTKTKQYPLSLNRLQITQQFQERPIRKESKLRTNIIIIKTDKKTIIINPKSTLILLRTRSPSPDLKIHKRESDTSYNTKKRQTKKIRKIRNIIKIVKIRKIKK